MDSHGAETGDPLVAIRETGAARFAPALRLATGSVAESERQVAELVGAVAHRLGPIDVLVLNATGPQPEAPVAEVAWEDHLDQLSFFVKSPVLLGRAVLPAMRARRHGRIVQVDSEVADRPPPGRSAYATAWGKVFRRVARITVAA